VRVLSTHALLNSGRPVEVERLADLDAVAGAAGPGAPLELLSLAQVVAFDQFTLERWDAADALFDDVVSAAKRASYVGVHVFGSAMRGEVLWRLGRWSEARTEANADVEHHLRLDVVQGGFGHATLARVAAATGATGEAVRIARMAVEHGDRIGMASMSAWGRHALGLAALADDRPDEAVQQLDWIWRLCRRGGVENPGILWWQGDLVEAFVLAGALDDARRLLSWMEGVGSPYGTAWPQAILDRGRGLVHGDLAAARCSVQRLDVARAPFEAARSRLVAASLAEPDERRVEAERALGVFEALGAVRWERDARTVLGAGDRPARPASSTLLTPAELRVALAISEGMTNRQAATSLALSPKTVDAHLQAIYRKLGVRGRTELALAISRERESAIGRPVPSRTTGT
jgi:DNA-binding CsgD family transcriptional regulator